MHKQKLLKLALFLFCFGLIIIRVLEVPLYSEGDGRNFIRGDSYSDKNVHSAVKFFHKHGFRKTSFLPVYGYDSLGDENYTVYTHYPALPDILAGTYAYLLDTTNITALRIFPVLISIAWFFLLFHILNTLLPDRQKAFVSASIIVLSTYFLGWADTLHKHTYEEAFKWIFVYLLFLYYERLKPNNFLLGVLCLFFLIIANISFEPTAYLAIVVLGFTWIYQKSIITRETVLLGFSAIAGFGIHFYQVAIHAGSWEAAKDDLMSAAVVRTTGSATDMMNTERNITWWDYLLFPYYMLNRIERYFLIPGWAFLVLAYLGMRNLRRKNEKIFKIGLVLMAASIIWGLVMPQHFIVHTFTTKQIGLFYGFIIGYGICAYWPYCKAAFQKRQPLLIALHVIFIGYIMGMFLTQQVWDMYIKYGWFYPFLNP